MDFQNDHLPSENGSLKNCLCAKLKEMNQMKNDVK